MAKQKGAQRMHLCKTEKKLVNASIFNVLTNPLAPNVTYL